MVNAGFGSTGDFNALAEQYFNAWGNALRNASGQAAPMHGAHAWGDALNMWSQFAHGGRGEMDRSLGQFNQQARQWYAQMQQVAAQFAGQQAGARDIVDGWKKALGAASENPFPEMFRSMGGGAMPGMQQWMDDASPYLDNWRRELNSQLSLPTFGLAREHQERWQALARAQLDYQQTNNAFNALLAKSGQRAFELFEDKLAEREEPGRQIASARALFDLWIDAAEEAYAEAALSLEFREAYGAMVNAQMRLRNGMQRELELVCGQLGMPTRTEMDSAHRKITELQRELRRLRSADARAPRPRASTPQSSAAEPVAPAKSVVQAASTKASKQAAKKVTKQAAKKSARKVTRKAANKAAAKSGKVVKKAAGKTAAKPAKKAANKAVKKAAKKATKQATKKAAKRNALGGIPMPVAPGTEARNKGGR